MRAVLFSRDHFPTFKANLRIAQIRLSSRMVIRYRPVKSLPAVVEVNIVYTTYGIKNRETISSAMVCAGMVPMPLQRRET